MFWSHPYPWANAHGAAVTKAAAQTAGQWKTWYWVCFGGIIAFLLSIPLLRGRWRPRDARRDEAEREAMVPGRAGQAQRLALTRGRHRGDRHHGPFGGKIF